MRRSSLMHSLSYWRRRRKGEGRFPYPQTMKNVGKITLQMKKYQSIMKEIHQKA